MKCPFCNHAESKVVDSRPAEENTAIRRRRECLSCSKRFTTRELLEATPILVVKKCGTRQSFDRSKVLQGLLRACEKRNVPLETLDQITKEIETELQNKMEREILSTQIGELTLEKLKKIDEVAYVRFASVYRDFQDINSFREELNNLSEE
ncbi:MAG: transcriptional regulator NrdR [Eubacteriales bacterium]